MKLLISDLHLEEARPDITRAFLHLLDSRASRADELYILGDFFDAWVGDDGMSPFQHSIAAALRRISDQGVKIFIMHGNRDFLIGEAFCRKAGCRLLKDPSVLDFGSQRVLLMHGDSLCIDDLGYMRLRRVLRNPLVLWLLRRLPLGSRHALARKLRNESRAQTRMKAAQITDVSPEEVVRVMQHHQVQTLIHGHTHRPAEHLLQLGSQPARRLVLGDWDRKGWALSWENGVFQLECFPLA